MALGTKELILVFKAATEKAQKNIKDVGESLKNVGKSGKVAQGGLSMMGKGFKFVGKAIKTAGIGLFVALLSQLTGVFQGNQKTADTFGRIMIKLKPVFDAVGDAIGVVADVLEGLIDMFNGAIGFIGSLIGYTDDAGDSMEDMAADVVNLRNEVKLMNALLALTQLEYQREAELQRQLRDDTSKSIDSRIEANEKLGKVLEEQFEKEKEMAEEQLRLAVMEKDLDEDNIDAYVKIVEARTKLAEIDERITSQRSEQLTKRRTSKTSRGENKTRNRGRKKSQ